MTANEHTPLVVLISGSGTNLQAIIDAAANDLPVNIRAVISNKPGVKGLERAANSGIETQVLEHRQFPERTDYEHALIKLIDGYQPALVVLAGYMRILTPLFVNHYAGQMLNIHPSLLPKFRGLNTHERALDAGEMLHGVSIHFVTEELDGGPLIAQAQVKVMPDDDPDRLGARVLEREHQLYPLVIRWFAERRLVLAENNTVMLDGEPLRDPKVYGPDDPIV